MHRLLGMRPSALVASSRRWLECRCMELRAGIASWTMRFLGHSNVTNLSTTEQTTNQKERERERERERSSEPGRWERAGTRTGRMDTPRDLLGSWQWRSREQVFRIVGGSSSIETQSRSIVSCKSMRPTVLLLGVGWCGGGGGVVGGRGDWSPSSSSGVRATGPKIDPFKATNQPMRVSG